MASRTFPDILEVDFDALSVIEFSFLPSILRHATGTYGHVTRSVALSGHDWLTTAPRYGAEAETPWSGRRGSNSRSQLGKPYASVNRGIRAGQSSNHIDQEEGSRSCGSRVGMQSILSRCAGARDAIRAVRVPHHRALRCR